MAVNKNFVVKNGLEVATDLVFASSTLDKVGIGSTLPSATLEVGGDFKATGNSTVVGIATFSNNIDANGDLDVDGHTELDNLNVSGIATFAGTLDFNGDLDVDGHLEVDNINVSGVSTFTGDIDANGGLDVDGHTELDDLGVSGVSTFSSAINATDIIKGYEYTAVPYGSTVTLAVTVVSKDSTHRYNGTGSGSGYEIDGIQAPFLTLTPGRTYRFTNNNTGSHPFKFYLEADKTTEYTSGVNFQNTYTEITISDTTPEVLHYQCSNHEYMGNAVQTNSNTIVVSAASTFSGDLDINASIDVDGHTELDDLRVSGVSTLSGNTFVGSAVSIYASSGIVSATEFYGDGSNLSGIVADSGGSLGFSTGANPGYGITFLNFTGGGVGSLTTPNSGIATISIISGGINYNDLSVTTNSAGTAALQYNTGTGNFLYTPPDLSSYLTTTGNGSGLTNIVTSVIAGDNISVSGGTGNVTITGLANTSNVRADTLVVTGVSTLGDVNARHGSYTGVVTATTFLGNLTGNVSGNISGATGTFSGDVSIGGTLTYEDVTNVDSVGLITARSGIIVNGAGIGLSVTEGGARVTGVVTASNFNATSDIKLKENITTVDNALGVVNQLRGVRFDWRESGGGDYGVIAQELEEVLPELVSQGDPKSVNYNGIIGVLIEAIKDLTEKVERLEDK